MKNVRFGLVGCGYISPNHAWSISVLEDAELVAVMDINEKAARKIGERFKADWYTEYDSLLNRNDIDAIAIATPSGLLHAELGIKAAQMGKHVIVEKPLATTLEQANSLIEECKKRKVKLAGIFQERFTKAAQQLKKAADESRFGAKFLGSAYIKWYRLQNYYDTSGGWRGTWKYDGGGSLINQSIHAIDLLQWIMGPVRRVHGRIAVRTHRIETEDIGVATLEFENGAFGVIESTTSAYPGLFTRLEICGEKGTVVIENKAIKTWKFIETREDDPKEEEVPGGEIVGAGPNVGLVEIDPSKSGILHKAQYDDFVKAIKEDRKPLVDGIEAKKALEIILGIYRSAQEKREIDFPLKIIK